MTTPADRVLNANRDVIALTRCYHHGRRVTASHVIANLTDRETALTLAAACNALHIVVGSFAELAGTTPDTLYTALVVAIDNATIEGPPVE